MKTVTRAEIKVITGKSHSVHDDDFHVRCAIVRLTRRHHECKCGSRDVAAYFRRTRYVQGEPIGELQTFCELDVHMLTCRTCGKSWYESFSFLPRPQGRITKAFARLLLKFRESMSITDVARDFGVDWRCVKDAERECLAEKCKAVSPEGVEALTIDEMFRRRAREQHLQHRDDPRHCRPDRSARCPAFRIICGRTGTCGDFALFAMGSLRRRLVARQGVHSPRSLPGRSSVLLLV